MGPRRRAEVPLRSDLGLCRGGVPYRRAALAGPEGRCLDPFTGRTAPGWDLVDALLAHTRPALTATGDLDVVTNTLSWLRAHGCGAARQRTALHTNGDLPTVVDLLAAATNRDPGNSAVPAPVHPGRPPLSAH